MICEIKNIPVYYEEYGEGRPVICIHGNTVDHRIMKGCLEPVFDHIDGFKRIYIDLPGMGQTPAEDWILNADIMLEIIIEFINKIIGEENFLVIGESYGGYFAQGLVFKMPNKIDGIFLICPVTFAISSKRNLPEKTLVYEDKNMNMIEDDSNKENFMSMAVVANKEIFDKYCRDILTGVEVADFDFLNKYNNSYGYAFTFEEQLKKINFLKPSCILTGKQDHIVGFEDSFQTLYRFPRATFAVLDASGHNLQIENEKLFNGFVLDWISRVQDKFI